MKDEFIGELSDDAQESAQADRLYTMKERANQVIIHLPLGGSEEENEIIIEAVREFVGEKEGRAYKLV